METWKLLDGETEVRDEGTAVRFRVYCRPPCEPTRLLRCYGEAEPNDLLVGVLEPQNGRLTLERRISRESLRQSGIRELPKKFYLSDGGARSRGEPPKPETADAAMENVSEQAADAAPVEEAIPVEAANAVPVAETVPTGAVDASPVSDAVPAGAVDTSPVGETVSAKSESAAEAPVSQPAAAANAEQEPADAAPEPCSKATEHEGQTVPVSPAASRHEGAIQSSPAPRSTSASEDAGSGTPPRRTGTNRAVSPQPFPAPRGGIAAANRNSQPSPAPRSAGASGAVNADVQPRSVSRGINANEAAPPGVQPRSVSRGVNASETAPPGAQASSPPRDAGRRSASAPRAVPHTEFLRFPVDGCPLPASSQPAAADAAAPAFSANHSRDAVPFKTGDALLDAVIARGEATCEPSPNGLRITCPFSPKQPFALAFIATLCRVEHRIAILDWENV